MTKQLTELAAATLALMEREVAWLTEAPAGSNTGGIATVARTVGALHGELRKAYENDRARVGELDYAGQIRLIVDDWFAGLPPAKQADVLERMQRQRKEPGGAE